MLTKKKFFTNGIVSAWCTKSPKAFKKVVFWGYSRKSGISLLNVGSIVTCLRLYSELKTYSETMSQLSRKSDNGWDSWPIFWRKPSVTSDENLKIVISGSARFYTNKGLPCCRACVNWMNSSVSILSIKSWVGNCETSLKTVYICFRHFFVWQGLQTLRMSKTKKARLSTL